MKATFESCTPRRWPGAIAADRFLLLAGAALAATALSAPSAWAADTIETWDRGAFDLEAYVAYEGLDRPADARSLATEVVVGYGIVERFAAYAAGSLKSDAALGHIDPDLRVGAFGTPVAVGGFALDLLLELSAAGPGLDAFALAPGLELNLDSDSRFGRWGPYLRAGWTFDLGAAVGAGHSGYLTPGLHWFVRDGHELLFEYNLELSVLSIGQLRSGHAGGGPGLQRDAVPGVRAHLAGRGGAGEPRRRDVRSGRRRHRQRSVRQGIVPVASSGAGPRTRRSAAAVGVTRRSVRGCGAPGVAYLATGNT